MAPHAEWQHPPRHRPWTASRGRGGRGARRGGLSGRWAGCQVPAHRVAPGGQRDRSGAALAQRTVGEGGHLQQHPEPVGLSWCGTRGVKGANPAHKVCVKKLPDPCPPDVCHTQQHSYGLQHLAHDGRRVPEGAELCQVLHAHRGRGGRHREPLVREQRAAGARGGVRGARGEGRQPAAPHVGRRQPLLRCAGGLAADLGHGLRLCSCLQRVAWQAAHARLQGLHRWLLTARAGIASQAFRAGRAKLRRPAAAGPPRAAHAVGRHLRPATALHGHWLLRLHVDGPRLHGGGAALHRALAEGRPLQHEARGELFHGAAGAPVLRGEHRVPWQRQLWAARREDVSGHGDLTGCRRLGQAKVAHRDAQRLGGAPAGIRAHLLREGTGVLERGCRARAALDSVVGWLAPLCEGRSPCLKGGMRRLLALGRPSGLWGCWHRRGQAVVARDEGGWRLLLGPGALRRLKGSRCQLAVRPDCLDGRLPSRHGPGTRGQWSLRGRGARAAVHAGAALQRGVAVRWRPCVGRLRCLHHRCAACLRLRRGLPRAP
mmetsp:Transcript_59831/g.185695  ORF Transcript_59831/g.185695 Transcript_59831/m.185695 type:complete len:544 (+) Transcript_59831:45-1676(+)